MRKIESKRDVCEGRGRGTRWLVSPSPCGVVGRGLKSEDLTTCQVLEVPRGEGGGGKGIAIPLIAGSSTMVSRVVVARGTIIRPAKNLVTIGETTSSNRVPMFSRPLPIN